MLLKSTSVSFESATNDGLLKGNIGVKSAPFRLASYWVVLNLLRMWVVCKNSYNHTYGCCIFYGQIWELVLKANILVINTKSL